MRHPLPGLTLALVLALSACSSGGEPEPDGVLTTAPVPTATGPAPSTDPEPEPAVAPPAGVRVTELEDGAVGIAAVGTSYWLALADAGTVLGSRKDPVPVGAFPLRLVATPDGVWVSVIGDGTLVRLDPASGKVDLRTTLKPARSEPEGLAYADGLLWVVDQAGDRVLALDPATGKVRAEYPTGHEPRLVTVGPSGVFVADYTGGTVTRIADGRATTHNAGSCLTPQGLAEAAGVVWVACTVDGQVVGLDARTLRPVARIRHLDAADAVVADGDTVYVVGQRGPTVWTIDARTRSLTHTLLLGDAGPTRENVAAAVVGRRLVVTHPDVRRVYGIPLRLLAARE